MVVIAVNLIYGTSIGRDVKDGLELDDGKWRYIEKLPNIAILQIPNGYRNNFGLLKAVCCWSRFENLKKK